MEKSQRKNEKALYDLAVEQIKTYERKIEQIQGFYERQKELAQDAIEELRTRRVRIGEIASEALQQAQQKRAEAKAHQDAKQKVQNLTQSSASSQSGSNQPMQVDAISTKRTR